MDLAASPSGLVLERLNPGIDLNGRPNAITPIHVSFYEAFHLLTALSLVDAEHVGAAFGGAQGHQNAVVFEALQPSQVREITAPIEKPSRSMV